MKQKLIFIGVATLGALIFIYYNNDHKECVNLIKYSVDNNGNEISREQHICNERFNF